MSYAIARGASRLWVGSNLLIGWINLMVSNRETMEPGKFETPWEVEPVTLLGALDCGDFLLFAADSGVGYGGYRTTEDAHR